MNCAPAKHKTVDGNAELPSDLIVKGYIIIVY